MKKPIYSFIVLSLIVLTSFAQDKLLTTKDAIYMNPEVYPARIPQIQWIGNSDDYAFAKDNSFFRLSCMPVPGSE